MPRRAPKVPTAVLSPENGVAYRNYEISNFTQFKDLIGRELIETERDQLKEMGKHYLLRRAIELDSKTAAEIGQYVARTKKAAATLRQLLIQHARASTEANTLAFLAGNVIDEHFKDRPMSRMITGKVDSHTLPRLLRDFERACDAAAQTRVQAAKTPESWLGLIRALDAWATDVGLPTQVSKGTRGKMTPSPYMQVVQAVQQTFPEPLRQHFHAMVTPDALAQAIVRARQDIKYLPTAE
jgi:hypothetical protein